RDRVLELITLGYHQDATSACIRDLSTDSLLCARTQPGLRPWWSFPRRRLAHFHRVERCIFSVARAIDSRINTSASVPDGLRRDPAMRLEYRSLMVFCPR